MEETGMHTEFSWGNALKRGHFKNEKAMDGQ